MNYIKHTLLENEQIVYYTGPHWIIFSPALISLALLMLFVLFGDFIIPSAIFGFNVLAFLDAGIFILTLVQFLIGYLRYKTSEYGITNQRIIIKVGFIRRNTLEVLLKRVESIQVNQSIPGRLLNYGSVTIRGTGGSRDTFNFVPSPLDFRRMAQQEIAQSQAL